VFDGVQPQKVLKNVPLFALRTKRKPLCWPASRAQKICPRQRIYKSATRASEPNVMVSGVVRVTTVDQDHQEVVVDEPAHGEFFGFASMPNRRRIKQRDRPGRNDLPGSRPEHIRILLQRKPLAGMDMLTVLAVSSCFAAIGAPTRHAEPQ